MNETLEHDFAGCPGDESATACVDGTSYGLCESKYCYGACENNGACPCKCHADASVDTSTDSGREE